jgi:tRNA threonylcarbamoyladenosine biosynthesis protein TsaB
MKKLIIDTSDNKVTAVELEINGIRDVLKREANRKTQEVLPMTVELLKKHDLKLTDITAIDVNIGPGSFTGLRVGISIANTLGLVLQVPINGKKVGEIVEPIYT